jgi:hypothetical protein
VRGDVLHGLDLGRVAWSLDNTMPAHSESIGAEGAEEFIPNPEA